MSVQYETRDGVVIRKFGMPPMFILLMDTNLIPADYGGVFRDSERLSPSPAHRGIGSYYVALLPRLVERLLGQANACS